MSNRQIVRGDHNVLISGVSGSQIQINYQNEARLVPLERAVIAVGANVTAPARLLKARSGIIPYIAHRQLVDDLEEWCHRAGPFATYLVGGRGGTGKTRLGVELCSRLRECDWLTGLLTKVADREELEALVRVQTSRLVVIDYAETRVETIASLLPLLAAHASEKNPVRVLLLVRAAPRRSDDWTEALRGHGEGLDLIADEMDTRVLADEPFDLDVRRELFAAAAAALRPRVGGRLPDPPQDLESPVFATPLNVVAAAYLALVDPDRQPTTRSELFDGLLEHEDRYWVSTGPNTPRDPQLRRRVVALSTLTAAGSEEEAAKLIGLVPNLGQEATRERRYELAAWAHSLYSGPAYWNPVEPDLPGEYLVASTYQNHPDVLAGVLRDRLGHGLVRPLQVYSRLASDQPSFAKALGPLLSAALPDLCTQAIREAAQETDMTLLLGTTSLASLLVRLLPAVPPDPESLVDILPQFPARSDLVLNRLAVVLNQQLADSYRNLADDNPAAYLPKLALWLDGLSTRLGDAGHKVEGLEASEEAVRIYRTLAEANPATYLPRLAIALNNLSLGLQDTGRRDEALRAVQEAVEIYGNLAATNPSAYFLPLAIALNNLSVCFGDVGCRDEALLAIEWAVKTYRILAETNPAVHEPNLATSLNNLANRLGDAGRQDEALRTIEEAVRIHEALAETNPAAYLPNLAMSLNSLSLHLAATGKGKGLPAIQKAVSIYRTLTRTNPRPYQAEFARALNNLSVGLTHAGRRDEALRAVEEAVGIYRSLAEDNPAAYHRDVALALNNLSVGLTHAGRRDEALRAVEEAVGIYRSLAEDNPSAYLPNLILSLNNLSNRLGETGRMDEAAIVKAEAAEATMECRRRGWLNDPHERGDSSGPEAP